MSVGAARAAAMSALLALQPLIALADGASFHDGFERLDNDRWYLSDGWSNGAHQNCEWRAGNAVAGDGTLRLVYGPNAADANTDRAFACAEVQTKERFGFGTYEARLRAVGRSGYNSAFFSYIGPTDGVPHDEIDFEVLGRDAARVQLNRYVDGKGGHEQMVPVPGGADAEFHDYAYVWEPGRLRWYVDGTLVGEATDAATIPASPMKIFASLWAGETSPDWLGRFDGPLVEDDRPTMEIDWIAYTAPGEACLFPDSITCAAR